MAYDDVFVGQILLFPFNFPPKGFAFCDGQVLNISQNTALFALLGTTYGGNGQTTFALPDLRGRVPLHPGQGQGLSTRDLGEASGSERVVVTTPQIPVHTHTISFPLIATAKASSGPANQASPAGNVPAVESGTTTTYSNLAQDANMSPAGGIATSGAITAMPSGADQPHENRRPYLAINYCIALTGIFPSKS